MKKISCIAHRGASGVVPENTMLALRTAYESNADLIEFDVQITKDQQLVLFHDKTLERITGEASKISDFNLIDLMQKDFGKWKGDQFKGITIPLLSDVLKEIPHDAGFVLEIKPQNVEIESDFNLERLVLEELDGSDRGWDSGYISVRTEKSFEWIEENSSKYPVGLMIKKRSFQEYYDIVKSYGVKIAQVRRNLGRSEIEKLHDLDAKVMMFYADTQHEWDQLIADGVDGILTNFPAEMSEYLKMQGY